MPKPTFKEHEFWNPRIFETPYYLYLGWQCLINAIGISTLAKANYALDHGEIGIGSKLKSQLAFDQTRFLPSKLIPATLNEEQKLTMILEFAEEHGYPLILKSNVGCVGKGVAKLKDESQAREKAPLLMGDFILQQFTPFSYECGVFYTRLNGEARITGINKKHFPTVVGDGSRTVGDLAQDHKRFTPHWNAFLAEHDLSEVLPSGKEKRLSFIGSHTLGCKFTDDGHLLTPELEKAIFDIFESQPGFNFGRVDVKAESEEALQRGEFVVIEVNGVASLPTHMFDPKLSLFESYKIFLQHGKLLVKIAREHKNKDMPLMSYREVIKTIKQNQALLNEVHAKLMEG
jgi:hypothetical protein